MRFKVLVSEGEDGWLVVECPSIPGCVSQGKTVDEALENIKDAIQGCLDVMSERVQVKGCEKVLEVVA
ncbi:MAG: type II toxin-antitoxin system HicB family antitoxin [Methanothrix sp.]|jgi:predicted RNase H-like HicB family nuclease|nr:type II toxin-antitoxin system HicB family antitoxin [Methanothrix sp.]